MNNNLIFRYWNGSEFITSNDRTFVFLEDHCVIASVGDVETNKIQQFTGEVDCKNVPIFVGDIVRVDFRRTGSFICEVIFTHREFKFEFKVVPEDTDDLSFPLIINDHTEKIEVIGHIYQNKQR